MPSGLVVPPEVDAVIEEFDHAKSPFTAFEVGDALKKARGTLENPTAEENLGAWAEVLAFTLVDNRTSTSPWGTFFAPIGSGTDAEGNPVYIPDIASANADFIDHWTVRTEQIRHPVLKSRYADLVWEFCTVIADYPRDPEMARTAIEAYLASLSKTKLVELYDRFESALRALDLACLISDEERIGKARQALIGLHREAVEARQGLWWLAFDRLIPGKNAEVTDEERDELVGSLEGLVSHYGETDKPENFNPHALQDAATRLIRHYTRLQKSDDVKRLHEAIAKAFEHFAGISDPMVASAVLQSAVNAYRDAGLREESKRVRILMQKKIRESHEQMVPLETKIEIPREDMEKFLLAVVVDDIGSTFVRIASEFLPKRRDIEEQLQKTLEDAPLSALMPMHLIADDHVAARVGSVEDDPLGRMLQQAEMNFGISDIWLYQTLRKAIETHDLVPEHFATWANRLDLFDDVTFLIEGVRAWFDGDLVKMVHVLVPQIEHGLRSIVGQLGKPVTKGHPRITDVSVALSMGDILYVEDITDALGPDLTLYFRAIYADPRGLNLRNLVAHGIMKSEGVSGHLGRLLIHTLLVFGIWKELAEQRR